MTAAALALMLALQPGPAGAIDGEPARSGLWVEREPDGALVCEPGQGRFRLRVSLTGDEAEPDAGHWLYTGGEIVIDPGDQRERRFAVDDGMWDTTPGSLISDERAELTVMGARVIDGGMDSQRTGRFVLMVRREAGGDLTPVLAELSAGGGRRAETYVYSGIVEGRYTGFHDSDRDDRIRPLGRCGDEDG